MCRCIIYNNDNVKGEGGYEAIKWPDFYVLRAVVDYYL